MACTDMEVYGIAVGQGQLNLVELVDTSGEEAEYLGVYMFDCGGRGSVLNEQWNLVTEILERNGNCFKAIFISHTDSDHSNLLAEFADYLGNSPLYYSCIGDGKNTYLTDILKDLGITGTPLNGTDLVTSDGGEVGFLLQDEGVLVRVLLASSTGDANDASAIISMELEDFTAVFTGDATANAFGEAVNIIQAHKENGRYLAEKRCQFVAIPHHGSYTTATANDADMQNLKNFGQYLSAYSGVCSFARHSGWRHGSIQVIRACCTKLQTAKLHTVYITEDSLHLNIRQRTSLIIQIRRNTREER